MNYLCFFLILITLQLFQSRCLKQGCQRANYFKQLLRANYKNVISYENSLLISRKQNDFNGSDRLIGMLIRNEIYANSTDVRGTFCAKHQSIILSLRQHYELNTLVIWLWDGYTRYQNLVVYVSYLENETVIFDEVSAQSKVIYIQFSPQIVDKFKIYNRDGNSASTALNIIKVEAYYKK